MAKRATINLKDLFGIYHAASLSNDGHRCMIAPSPEIREQLKKELRRLKELSSNEMLSNLLTPKQQTRLGLNDGLIYPGNVFPICTSAAAVRTRSAQRAPLRGNIRVVVVLIEFPDKKISFNKKNYEDLFFSSGVIPTGSVKEYYKEVTNGLINIEGEVLGPLMMPKKIVHYANGNSGMGNSQPNARTMALHAAQAANPKIDFSKYDNDLNGYVDAFIIIHAGSGAEETAAKDDIWSHKWVLPGEFNADGTRIFAYLTVPEDCKLGVCVHELGHLLFGFPDLYDSDYSSEGIGDWCLMAGGSWNNKGLTPSHPCAWCKAQQGWVTVINQGSNQKNISIQDVKTGKKIYRLWKNGGPGNEYFLIENRQKKKFDKFIPGNGLLIWHVDDAMEDNENELHYKVSLMQADGKKDLEAGNNRGDESDCWPGGKKKTLFSKSTTPGSLSYGGLDSGVKVGEIKHSAGVIKASLYVNNGPATVSTRVNKSRDTQEPKKRNKSTRNRNHL